MGIRSGGVLTVSKVGVSAVTYMPYNGYSDNSVVSVSTVHRHTHPKLHVRTATLLNLPRSPTHELNPAHEFFCSRKLRLAPQDYSPWTPPTDRFSVRS